MSDSLPPIANDSWHFSNRLFLFTFGVYGGCQVYAWGERGLDGALESAAEWLKEHGPGLFSEPDYADAARELGAPDNWSDDDDWCTKVSEAAEVDHTYTESGWLLSWEWGVVEVSDADTFAAVKARSVASEAA